MQYTLTSCMTYLHVHTRHDNTIDGKRGRMGVGYENLLIPSHPIPSNRGSSLPPPRMMSGSRPQRPLDGYSCYILPRCYGKFIKHVVLPIARRRIGTWSICLLPCFLVCLLQRHALPRYYLPTYLPPSLNLPPPLPHFSDRHRVSSHRGNIWVPMARNRFPRTVDWKDPTKYKVSGAHIIRRMMRLTGFRRLSRIGREKSMSRPSLEN
ncbi:hypothetical protein F5Y09DRAFT_41333 [Xylaria sp. FL1042]|nr:hypothetical protein F5Y09DRAFT_41333 [Xylaria sp. FL1042]